MPQMSTQIGVKNVHAKNLCVSLKKLRIHSKTKEFSRHFCRSKHTQCAAAGYLRTETRSYGYMRFSHYVILTEQGRTYENRSTNGASYEKFNV